MSLYVTMTNGKVYEVAERNQAIIDGIYNETENHKFVSFGMSYTNNGNKKLDDLIVAVDSIVSIEVDSSY